MPIKSLIFDFDGLILDTETPEFLAWQSIYREYGQEIPIDEWGKIIGGAGISNFDAALHLSHLSQGQLDAASLRLRQRSETDRMIAESSALPGVIELIDEAKQHQLKLAVASSSRHVWVDGHLKRLGLFEAFDNIVCADDVAVGRTKPNPDLFLLALDKLEVQKEAAVVFEDSPNGVRAAKSAGIFVVAVPNPVTSQLGVDGADLVLKSLEKFNLKMFL
jgi:HAD superfamily hydrolase (TIGR01509 family)